VYDLLGIHDLEERGESYYQPMLAEVVTELEAKGLLVEDQGAKVVFVPGYSNREGDPLPLIVVNQHGGYGYATTDLAAIRHRTQDLGADEILYVVDAGQSQHLEMVFEAARMAGWVTNQRIKHVGFGLVLGDDGKRLRTRSGDNVKLVELLQEAVERSRAFVVTRAEERGQPLPDDLEHVAHVIGIGAVKYADLSQNRQSNYVFSYEKMLSLRGNTAPYLQYAYARMHSILREAEWDPTPPVAPRIAAGRGRTGHRRPRAEPPVPAPLRGGAVVQPVLRGLPGPQGRRASAHVAPRAVRCQRPPAPLGPRAPRDRRPRAHLTRSVSRDASR
jgi:arginyl-tRNA synthetase